MTIEEEEKIIENMYACSPLVKGSLDKIPPSVGKESQLPTADNSPGSAANIALNQMNSLESEEVLQRDFDLNASVYSPEPFKITPSKDSDCTHNENLSVGEDSLHCQE